MNKIGIACLVATAALLGCAPEKDMEKRVRELEERLDLVYRDMRETDARIARLIYRMDYAENDITGIRRDLFMTNSVPPRPPAMTAFGGGR